ncbi:hypothetical protein POSPLADRAFT_1035402 [Postia placenta MAD-698-R-SB12]|uniref:Uncharacterized protein n=1 Tax=Postia placenta MAD-698-R-SB12 TaxID=670580 RepID=A0A1X6MU62_9APHY|nr:hypothetical protein POSPLADRAFT_1035402 [Postia placenta MAD-698-R-SB12]OSX59898.1 hypothetical protein POSPLADRAFT_1035402 [Postia placenta MAD-698-R-SB12]
MSNTACQCARRTTQAMKMHHPKRGDRRSVIVTPGYRSAPASRHHRRAPRPQGRNLDSHSGQRPSNMHTSPVCTSATVSPDLPAELISAIIEQLYYDEDGNPDRRALYACSLVSASWTGPAQRLLFHTARLHGPHALAFLHAIHPARPSGTRLGEHVRRLEVRIGTGPGSGSPTSPDATSLRPTEFLTLLDHCPRLYELILRAYNVHAFEEPLTRALGALASDPARTPLRALSLLRAGVQSPLLYQLLAVFPSVRFLRLGSEMAAPLPKSPASVALTELVLYRLPSPRILSWLLASSLSTLAILDLRDAPDVQLTEILAPHGPRLRSLRLLRYNARGAALIRLCPALEELVLFQLSTFLPLANLPQTLEHLSFRDFSWTSNPSLQTIIAAIETLPRLRLLTCDANAKQHDDFPALRRKCEKKGVALRTDALPIRTFEDAVPVKRFPRRKSISNFPLMNERVGAADQLMQS